jgi:hypothetical protein
MQNNTKKETQDQREDRCHKESEEYYSLSTISKSELYWFHKGVEMGAKWVDSGDRIII